jgi:RNA polymerase sigma-70 factor (ECF subfamily)
VPDWNQILEEHGPAAWRQALRLLGNEADAADCYQAVLLEAFELSGRREIRNWSAFLRRLAIVRSLDRLRDRYRSKIDPRPIEEFSVAARDSVVAVAVETRELAERLRLALARLPENQAEAFALRWIGELDSDQVADRMGITPNHVAVLLHRARAALRSLLGEKPESEP